ncbi:MAG: terminase [Planctomyces sp.]|nr:terminase [Planctomyces sp.]
MVKLSAADRAVGKPTLEPWQAADFAPLDPAWRFLALGSRSNSSPQDAGDSQTPPQPPAPLHPTVHPTDSHILPTPWEIPAAPPLLRRAYLERPRGHSKTSDIALSCAWILAFAREPVNGIAAAADREQAQLLLQAIQRLVRLNPHLLGALQVQQECVVHKTTRSRLDVISSDVASSWGLLPDFVICDELCHWTKPELWHSLVSSAAKKPHTILAVLSNAGLGRTWQWDVREAARTSPEWHFSTLKGPQAAWITPEALAEQQELLPASVYARLWLNEWQQAEGDYVTLEEARACIDSSLVRQDYGKPWIRYVAAIDYAEKHDWTVAVILHAEGDRLVVDRMDVAIPTPGGPTPVAWVDNWLTWAANAFSDIEFVLDEYQLLSIIQTRAVELRLERFSFAGGNGNHALAMLLRQLVIERRVAWYPRCGSPEVDQHDFSHSPSPQPMSHSSVDSPRSFAAQPRELVLGSHPQGTDVRGENDLAHELATLILRQLPNNRIRFDHRNEPGFHDDRAFALAAACLKLTNSPPEPHLLKLTPPTPEGTFAW